MHNQLGTEGGATGGELGGASSREGDELVKRIRCHETAFISTMATRSDVIDEQINYLHSKIVTLAGQRKYDEIGQLREQIRDLEYQKLDINKVSELKIVMDIMKGVIKPSSEFDKLCSDAWDNNKSNTWEQHANRRLMVALFEAIVELDRKITSGNGR